MGAERNDMSNLKARLVKPTGLEFYDVAVRINTAVWDFVKFEFKNKASKDAGDARPNSTKGTSTIPTRYWQTHAVPLIEAARDMMHEITMANSLFPVMNDDDYRRRIAHQQNAIGHNAWIATLLRLTLNDIPTIDANKVETMLALTKQENKLLRAWKNSTKQRNKAPKGAE